MLHKLKVRKSLKQFFLKLHCPKNQTKYQTKFCPMKLGQKFVKYFVRYWALLSSQTSEDIVPQFLRMMTALIDTSSQELPHSPSTLNIVPGALLSLLIYNKYLGRVENCCRDLSTFTQVFAKQKMSISYCQQVLYIYPNFL